MANYGELAGAKAAMLSQAGHQGVLTNVDPGTRRRERPMQVLCLGRERTGTLSMRIALLELGYYDVYHMGSCSTENTRDQAWWNRAMAAKQGNGQFTRDDWECLLGDSMAITDLPSALFPEELVEIYPEARIVLTVRDTPEAWHTSVMNTTNKVVRAVSPRTVRHPGWNPLHLLYSFLAPSSGTSKFFGQCIELAGYDSVPTEGVRVYLEHNELVRKLAANRQFLEFNVKQGWKPLCDFLGKPVPDKPFPKVNDTADFDDRTRKVVFGMRMLFAVNACIYIVLPILVAFGAYRYQAGPSMWF